MQRAGQPRMAQECKWSGNANALRRGFLSVGFSFIAFFFVTSTVSPLYAQLKDSPIDVELLELKWEAPKTVVIYPGSKDTQSDVSATSSGRVYWYMPYRLTYKGTNPAKFFVSVRATSDKRGDTVPSYRDLVLPHVEKKIERLEQRELISKGDLISDSKTDEYRYVSYQPGEAKQCVAIFNPLDPEADEIRVYVHGLVNDVKMEDLGGGKFKIEERVLLITFERPGDELYPTLDDIKFKSKKWITLSFTTPDEG